MNRLALRGAWLKAHRWLGLTLGIFGIAIGVTGSAQVFDREIDPWLNPQRYAVAGPEVALTGAAYLKRAQRVLGDGATRMRISFPAADGSPVVVSARGADGLKRVFLDPQTGRVLETATGSDFLRIMHVFHENLMLRGYGGRELVGLVGFAMLISSLTGIYLWWPRGPWRQALRFRRAVALSRNLHLTFGFYGALGLAVLSFTGIYLAFPEGGRSVVGAIAPLSPALRGVRAPEPRAGEGLALDEAIAAAKALYPAATVAGLVLPDGARGVYRVQLREPGDTSKRGNTVVVLDPGSGAVLARSSPSTRTRGDAFLAWQRLLHSGEPFGVAGRAVVCAIGLLPALLALSGTMMWLRRRRMLRES